MPFLKRKTPGELVTLDSLAGMGFPVEEIPAQPVNKRKTVMKFISCSLLGGVLTGFALMVTLLGFILLFLNPAYAFWILLDNELPEAQAPSSITLLDKDGKQFATVSLAERIDLPNLAAVGKTNIDALLATEDRNFYQHPGFDWKATLRAAVTRKGGASGITQQLVKNIQFLTGDEKVKRKAVEHSITRKVQELKYAVAYEQQHSKNEILLNYFNLVSFGSPNVYGIEAASRHFFNKNAKDLTVAESAALIGSVNNPVRYKLTGKRWKDRQLVVLRAMLDTGKINEQVYNQAVKESLNVKPSPLPRSCSSSPYPFYCDLVIKSLYDNPRFGATPEEREKRVANGGFQVKTALDRTIQDKAQAVINGFSSTGRIVAPAVMVEPGTGKVQAAVVNRKYGLGEGETTINPLLHQTGTGSSFKMFTLAAAVKDGWTEDKLAFPSLGCPLRIPGYETPAGGLTNSVSCALQGGYLNFKQATAYSSNTWFATLEYKIGVDKVKQFAHSVGLTNDKGITDKSLSYTLGVTSESPVDMSAAYATFAAKGVYCPAQPVTSVTKNGQEYIPNEEYLPVGCRSVLTPKQAAIVLKAMRANVSGEIPDSFGHGKDIPGYHTAGKSGTNQLFNSAWAQLTGNHSLFVDVYDFDRLTRGISTVQFNGRRVSWMENAAETAGYLIYKSVLPGTPPVLLDFDTTEDKLISPSRKEYEYATVVPSLVGFTPETALKYAEQSGFTLKLKKPIKVISKQKPEGDSKVSLSGKRIIEVE